MTNGWTGGQYSLYRALFGLALLVQLARTLPEAPVLALALPIAGAFALGAADRLAAVVLAVIWTGVFAADGAIASALLIAHALVPGHPFGSLAARGRIDPGGGWRMPGWLPLGARLALVAALVSGDRSPWMLLLAFLAFDPAWIAPVRDAEPARLFYDGACGLCHSAVRFLLAEDRDGRGFRFAPLQGEAFERAIPASVRATLPDSLVLVVPDGAHLLRSAAVLEICARLGGFWRALGIASRLIPTPWLDRAYDGVARVRARVFTRPADACPVLPPELRARFTLPASH